MKMKQHHTIENILC